MKAVDALWLDVVFALRLLRKSPTFAAALVLTLALGVGVNTAVFSVVNAFILRPLPVRDADRLVVLASQHASERTLHGLSFADLQDYRLATPDVFDDIAGYSVGFVGLAPATGRPDRVLATWVTGNYFALLDLRPAVGRLVRADEGRSGRVDAVAVLGYSTWQRRFGGDRSVIGKRVLVNGTPCTVVGVAPHGFPGTFAFSESELYLPLNWRAGGSLDDRRGRGLHALARLRPGVSIEKAQAALTAVAARLAREHPESNANIGVRVVPERLARPEEDQFRTNAVGAGVMLAMVAIVMIVAVVNVTNLLLARATGRRQELAIRAALGAGRGRLIQQMMAEGLVIATLGGGLGLLLGTWSARALAAIRLPGDLPVRFDFQLDGRVLAYTATAALAAGLLVGFVPARRMSGADLNLTLRQIRHSPENLHRVRDLLVVAQIALCFVLLAVAGLFARSLLAAERADLGFRPEGVLNVHMDVGQLGYTEQRARAFFDAVSERVRSLPGVENLSFAFTIPMGYVRVNAAVEAEGQARDRSERLLAGKNIVSPGYLQTMGVQLLRGRDFGDMDTAHDRPVAIVNQRLAELLWPARDPIGRRFRSVGQGEPWIEIVGVTNTGKYEFLFEDPRPYFYVPVTQEFVGLRVLQVRTSLAPEALAPSIARVIRDLEPNLPIYDVQTMSRALGSGLGFFPIRVGAVSSAVLGALAFALAMVGLYGVVSYLASQRAHEIGVRMAVGATERDILRLVLRDGMQLVIAGLAIGALATLACSRIVGRFLFGIPALDPLTVAGVTPLLACVALMACAIPAWRAARADPTTVLRAE
jgi:predicted permease